MKPRSGSTGRHGHGAPVFAAAVALLCGCGGQTAGSAGSSTTDAAATSDSPSHDAPGLDVAPTDGAVLLDAPPDVASEAPGDAAPCNPGNGAPLCDSANSYACASGGQTFTVTFSATIDGCDQTTPRVACLPQTSSQTPIAGLVSGAQFEACDGVILHGAAACGPEGSWSLQGKQLTMVFANPDVTVVCTGS